MTVSSLTLHSCSIQTQESYDQNLVEKHQDSKNCTSIKEDLHQRRSIPIPDCVAVAWRSPVTSFMTCGYNDAPAISNIIIAHIWNA